MCESQNTAENTAAFLDRCRELDEIGKLRTDYFKTLALLKALKDGTMTIDDIELTVDGFVLKLPKQPMPPGAIPVPTVIDPSDAEQTPGDEVENPAEEAEPQSIQ